MKQAKDQIKGLLFLTALLLLSAALLSFLAGCGSEEMSQESGEAVAAVAEPTAAPPTPTDEPDAVIEAVALVVEDAGPDTCLDCHTDKELLIDTADPVEEVVSENEGEG